VFVKVSSLLLLMFSPIEETYSASACHLISLFLFFW